MEWPQKKKCKDRRFKIMAEQLNEDKLIVKNDNIVKKGAKDGWALIKIIWIFNKNIQWVLMVFLKLKNMQKKIIN